MNRFKFHLNRSEVLLLVLIFLISFVASGRWTFWLAAWISPILMLRFFRNRESAWSSYFLMLIAVWIPNIVAWNGILPQPQLIYHVIFMLVQSAFSLVPYLVDRLVVRNYAQLYGNSIWLTSIFPIVATGFEYLNVGNSPLGSFGGTGYSQYALTPMLQFASVAGIWGIAFLIFWLASTVNWAWEHGFEIRKVRGALIIIVSILLLVLLYGGARTLTVVGATEHVKVASFTLEEVDPSTLFPLRTEDEAAFVKRTAEIRNRYLAHTVEVAQEGVELVLWPELSGVGLVADIDALIAEARQIADTNNLYLAVPTFAFYPDEDRPAENRLQLIDPDGQIVLNHVKYGGNILEGTLPGKGQLQFVDTPFGRITGAVCWDADFPGIIQQAGEADTDILLVPARVWEAVSDMHAEMLAFRAVENGLTVLYQADGGASQITNPWGQALQRVDPYAGDANEIIFQMPVQKTHTLYPMIGENFGMALQLLAGLCLLAAIALTIVNYRKKKSEVISGGI